MIYSTDIRSRILGLFFQSSELWLAIDDLLEPFEGVPLYLQYENILRVEDKYPVLGLLRFHLLLLKDEGLLVSESTDGWGIFRLGVKSFTWDNYNPSLPKFNKFTIDELKQLQKSNETAAAYSYTE